MLSLVPPVYLRWLSYRLRRLAGRRGRDPADRSDLVTLDRCRVAGVAFGGSMARIGTWKAAPSFQSVVTVTGKPASIL
jgi:hypothetical protein